MSDIIPPTPGRSTITLHMTEYTQAILRRKAKLHGVSMSSIVDDLVHADFVNDQVRITRTHLRQQYAEVLNSG